PSAGAMRRTAIPTQREGERDDDPKPPADRLRGDCAGAHPGPRAVLAGRRRKEGAYGRREGQAWLEGPLRRQVASRLEGGKLRRRRGGTGRGRGGRNGAGQ